MVLRLSNQEPGAAIYGKKKKIAALAAEDEDTEDMSFDLFMDTHSEVRDELLVGPDVVETGMKYASVLFEEFASKQVVSQAQAGMNTNAPVSVGECVLVESLYQPPYPRTEEDEGADSGEIDMSVDQVIDAKVDGEETYTESQSCRWGSADEKMFASVPSPGEKFGVSGGCDTSEAVFVNVDMIDVGKETTRGTKPMTTRSGDARGDDDPLYADVQRRDDAGPARDAAGGRADERDDLGGMPTDQSDESTGERGSTGGDAVCLVTDPLTQQDAAEATREGGGSGGRRERSRDAAAARTMRLHYSNRGARASRARITEWI